eukprot:gene11664-11807_t
MAALWDLETVAPYIGDGQNHSLYLQWHPRDHCQSTTVETAPPNNSPVGDIWNIKEFTGASRRYTRSNFRGFEAEPQVNINVTVVQLNKAGLKFQLKLFGFGITSSTHTWRTIPGRRVNITTVFAIGDPSLPADINKLVNCGFSRGQEPLAVARKLQLHIIEEFGNFPNTFMTEISLYLRGVPGEYPESY